MPLPLPLALMLALALLAGPFTLGCATETEAGGRPPQKTSVEAQARAIFDSDTFRQHLEPDPRPDGELLGVHLIRASDTGRLVDAYDLGYIREERLVFTLPDRPWVEDDATRIAVRTNDVFPHPVQQPDGSYRLYQAVERKLISILDVDGRPVGTIDEHGNVYRFNPSTYDLELIGFGTADQAVRMLFNIRTTRRMDREQLQPVTIQPEVFLTKLDGQTAQERFDASLSSGLTSRGRERVLDNDVVDAMRDYNRALELNPVNVEALIARGDAYRVRGDHEAALNDYDRALTFQPARWDVWVKRGQALVALQRVGEAEDSFVEAYRCAPDDAIAEVRRSQEALELERP